MTRINTNVSSLVAQNTLNRSSADLQTSLTRLSTGLRINSGKDDPAGLIASEALRADMTSIEKAISNSTRANLMIGTADSALGQVSSLLNDIRGLVVEAANVGAMSSEQIEANQLQVDSSLEAINRIAQTTTFQGRRLLDGSLAFNTTAHTVPTIRDVQIDQANLGAVGQVAVEVNISSAATVAEISNTNGFTAAATARADINLGSGKVIAAGAGGAGSLYINAIDSTDDATTVGVQFVDNNLAAVSVTYADGDADILINGDWDASAGAFAPDWDDVTGALALNADFAARFVATSTSGVALVGAIAGDKGSLEARSLRISAQSQGADYNGVRVSVAAAATNTATYDATQKTLSITVANGADQTLTALATALDTALDGDFDVAVQTGTATGAINAGNTDIEQTANTENTGGNVLKGDLVLSLGGSIGREVFSFQKDSSVNQVVSAINLVSDATGVVASQSSGTLVLNSVQYGSKGVVDAEVISEGTGGVFEASWVNNESRGEGQDIQATVNGISAKGDGNTLSINTATLDLALTVDDGSDTNFVFDITGGGALFQMGPDVVSNQQARLGIQSLYTAKMGGPSGRLYELASGGDKTLAADPSSAYQVVSEVISKVATLRGRLGAFQRTTVETNIASLTDTLVNLTDAESAIRDADFAKESSSLTRAQILVQSGTSVLGIANSTPQSVLSLLR